MKKFCCAILLSLLSLSAIADTRYVVDVIYITLRSGPGNDFRVLKTLKTGDKMEVLEEQEEHSQVRLEDGTEGWVRTKYLDSQPSAALRLAQLELRVEALQKENEELKKSNTELNSELNTVSKSKIQAERELAKATKEKDQIAQVAAKPLALQQQNQELITRNTQIEEEIIKLQRENKVFSEAADRKWFLAGGAVVVVGLIIGLIIPRIRWRRGGDSWNWS